MKFKLFLYLIVLVVLLPTIISGCTSSGMNRSFDGSDKKITLYAADGKVINTWISDGRVLGEDHSDGWYFQSKKTGKVVIISGTTIIEDAD